MNSIEERGDIKKDHLIGLYTPLQSADNTKLRLIKRDYGPIRGLL